MRSLLKPALFSLFGLFCLALNTDAQQPVPPAPVAPPAPPTATRTLVVQGTPGAAPLAAISLPKVGVTMSSSLGPTGPTASTRHG